MRRYNVGKNQELKMERWAERGDHAGATALVDRLGTSVSTQTAPMVPQRRVRPLYGPLVAAGAAVLTIIVIVSGVLAVRLGPADEVTPADSTPAPTAVVATVPAPDAVDVEPTQPTTPVAEPVTPATIDMATWTEVPLDPEVFGYEPVYDAEWLDGVLYAVGSSNDEEGEFASFRGTVWRSPDGVAWERSATVSDPGSLMYSIAGSDSLLVAVGEIRLDQTHGAIWTSQDGDTWSRVPHDDDTFGPGFGKIHEVAAGGPGFVAVGELCEDSESCFAQPTVWVSENGTSWTRLPFVEGTPGVINDLTSHNGTLVAVGRTFSESGDSAAIWISDDGYTWERIVDDGVFDRAGSQWISAVTSSETGIVAVGASMEPGELSNAVVWSSPDGRVWTISESYTADRPASATFEGVTTVGSQYVIVGRQFVYVGPENEDEIRELGLVGEMGMVWTSSNGSTWTRVNTGKQFFTASLAVVTGNPTGAFTFANMDGLTIWRTPTN